MKNADADVNFSADVTHITNFGCTNRKQIEIRDEREKDTDDFPKEPRGFRGFEFI